MTEVQQQKKDKENLLVQLEQLPSTRELSLVITKLEEGLICLEKSKKKQKNQK
ncbi:hypothetical protein [Capnocytophaga gingivalis]|uniref:Uncharacterized protein n=1 Tax=Capnocytophaga gingivalis TaxID=1017 RepID=A0ABU5YDI0_9FLAO|nr:hypothetical protein [Capnocytophaga gingivalis]MEB3042020.1 hypothetical protein [Capnocytophaga gingivalis]